MTHFLTKISVTPQILAVRNIYSTYGMHRLVYDLFEQSAEGGDRPGPIWSVDESRSGSSLVILSNRMPRITDELIEINRKTISFPDRLLDNDEFSFRILINATRCSGGKRIPIKTPVEVATWFAKVGRDHGFEISGSELFVERVFPDRFSKRHGNSLQTIIINKASIRGRFRVIDHVSFRHAFYNGIGKAKAFGCGMLQAIAIR